MHPLTEELIAVYAERGLEHVADDDAFVTRVHERKGDTAFETEHLHVQQIARHLEQTLGGQTHRNQVRFALKVLQHLRSDPDRQTICIQLTRRRFKPGWSPEQAEYYEQAREKMAGWRHFFLSFTNHNPTPADAMAVNVTHRRLIMKGLSRTISPPQTCRENLLAALLYKRLVDAKLDGSYFPGERGKDDVMTELLDEARRSFVFIQLMQDTIFGAPPNYCHMEFEAATEDDDRALIFVLPSRLDDFVPRDDVDFDFHAWHETVHRHDVVELIPSSKQSDIDNTLKLIWDRLVEPVRNAKEKIFDGIPL